MTSIYFDDLIGSVKLRTIIFVRNSHAQEKFGDSVKRVSLAQGSLSGTVTDQESGETLIGVNILIDELNLGDATDAEGYFEFDNVPAGTYELEARYVGYDAISETITIQDGQETVLNLEMSVSTAELDEAVVTAFGVERDRRAVGYSVQDIDSDNITRAGSGDLLGSMQGQVSGVQITRGGGGAGQGSQMFIRGFTSLDPGADNQPLFVVDGVPIDNSTQESFGRARGMSNRAMDIDPNDIESVSVLKSAPATALYMVFGQQMVQL